MDIKEFDSLCRTAIFKNYHKEIDELGSSHIKIRKGDGGKEAFKHSEVINGISTECISESIEERIDLLSEKQKAIIYLYYLAGFSDREVSEILDITERCARYNRKRSLELLKEGMNKC